MDILNRATIFHRTLIFFVMVLCYFYERQRCKTFIFQFWLNSKEATTVHNSPQQQHLQLLLKCNVLWHAAFLLLLYIFLRQSVCSYKHHSRFWRSHHITFFSFSLQMNRWTRRRRRRGSSAGTGPPSTAASCRLWSECLRGHTTPTPSSGRTWPAGSTSPRPESRYEQGQQHERKKLLILCESLRGFYFDTASSLTK